MQLVGMAGIIILLHVCYNSRRRGGEGERMDRREEGRDRGRKRWIQEERGGRVKKKGDLGMSIKLHVLANPVPG